MKSVNLSIFGYIFTVICLIAFIPKAEFEKNPEAFLEALKQIYAEKHHMCLSREVGCRPPTITIGENKLGQIVVIIDHPKEEV